jgi:hypothetical protein
MLPVPLVAQWLPYRVVVIRINKKYIFQRNNLAFRLFFKLAQSNGYCSRYNCSFVTNMCWYSVAYLADI